MGVKAVYHSRNLILLFTIISCFIIFTGNAFAEVVAIPTCKICTEDPCTDYCATPPCVSCEGNEGDSFIFFGGNSEGPAGLNFAWDFDGDSFADSYLMTDVKQYFKPNNTETDPDGWPVTLTVDASGEFNTSDPLYVKVNNIAPTAIMYVFDIANNVQYEEAFVYANNEITFYAEKSHDLADDTIVCGQTDTYCGIQNPQVDFSYDGITFNAEYTGKLIKHSWSTPGDYLVRLKVTDKDTPAMISYADILVHVIPYGPYVFVTGPTEPFTEGELVRFNANQPLTLPYDIVSYEWDFDYDAVAGFNAMATGDEVFYRFPTARQRPEEEPFEPYFDVAVRVTDENNGTFIATEKFYPENIPPVAVLEVSTIDDVVLIPTYDPEDGTPIYEFNEGQIMKFDSNKSYAGCLNPPETCEHSDGRYAPDEDPPVFTNAPGSVVAAQWDWNYDSIFTPSAEDTNRLETHAYAEDTDQNIVPGEPISVMLRVIDDDNNANFTSDNYTKIYVIVHDIEPVAEIRQCNQTGTSCSKPEAAIELQEGITAYLKSADISGNTDTVILVEWDFDYSGVEVEFNTEATTDSISEITEHEWLEMGTYTLGVRITDDDGKVAIATQEVVISDMPPTAIITPNDGTVFEVNEGETIRFSAENSLIAPGDGFTRFRWDDDYNQSTFTPRERWDYESLCSSNVCSQFDELSCEQTEDCPRGRGFLSRTVTDGPATQYIAVCVEDADTWQLGDSMNTGLCVTGADPNDASVSPRIATLEIQIKNVAPVFTNEPSLTIYENQTFEWTPTIYDPAGSLDTYSFVCDFEKLPEGASCSQETGLISWSPGQNDISCPPNVEIPHPFEHTVCDSDGDCTTYKGSIIVLNVNDPAKIVGYTGDTTIPVGEEAVITLDKSDPDTFCGNENFYFYVCRDGATYYTSDMVFQGETGIFRWTPSANDLGKKTVKLCVRDDECGSNSACNDCMTGCIEIEFDIADSNNLPVVHLEDDFEAEAGYICVNGTHEGNQTEQWEYKWSQKTVESNICINSIATYPDDPLACFATSIHGSYEIGLKANNGTNDGQEETVVVTVLNTQPGAVVFGDRNYDLGTIVNLYGGASKDYNLNDTISYGWTDDPEVLNENDRSEANPNFQTDPDNPALYNFSLTIEDKEGLLSPEGYADLTFESLDVDESGNIISALPYATFESKICSSEDDCESTDTTAPKVQQTFILDASDSKSRSETKKVALGYLWSFASGPSQPVITDTQDDHIVKVSTFDPGLYTFKLEVTEGLVSSKPFYKKVFVEHDTNAAPVADAGDDIINKQIKTVCTAPITKYASIELDGSNSRDPEAQSLTYKWRQIYGTIVPLHNPDTSNPSFLVFKPGLYSFELIVNDGTLDSKPDIVHVSVASETGSVPTAVLNYERMGNGIYIADPNETITLDASNSASITAGELNFNWSQTGGPSVVLSDWEGDAPTFNPDINGAIYSFRLLVSDNSGNVSIPFDIRMSVLSEANTPPVCSASQTEISSQAGQNVELDASETYDNEDDTLTYLWEQDLDASEEAVTITGSTQTKASFIPKKAGTYVFNFTAFDGIEYCTPVVVTVNVSGNSQPTADAGTDQIVCLGEEVQLDGSGSSDVDGNELTYEWNVEDDGDVGVSKENLQPDNTAVNPTFDAINPGTVILSLVVSDGLENGTSEKDEVQIQIKICDGDIDGDIDDDVISGDGDIDGDIDTEENGGGGGCNSISSSYVNIALSLFAAFIFIIAIAARRRFQ